MKKEEFIKMIKNRIENFSEFWDKNHQKDPEDFPLEMWTGDWIEQFDMFLDQEE